MACLPSARPSDFVMLITAAFEAPYSTTWLPRCPAEEAVDTIDPPLPSAIRRFATHCVAKNGALTFTSMVESNCSGGTSR